MIDRGLPRCRHYIGSVPKNDNAMSLKISQKFLVAVTVPVVFELALVGILFYLLGQADDARLREQQARELGNRAYALMGPFR